MSYIRKQLAKSKRKKVDSQVAQLASMLKNQDQLDKVLLQESDPFKRRQLFDYMKQFVQFPNPKFPTPILN